MADKHPVVFLRNRLLDAFESESRARVDPYLERIDVNLGHVVPLLPERRLGLKIIHQESSGRVGLCDKIKLEMQATNRPAVSMACPASAGVTPASGPTP
jgi:hypothetical protein